MYLSRDFDTFLTGGSFLVAYNWIFHNGAVMTQKKHDSEPYDAEPYAAQHYDAETHLAAIVIHVLHDVHPRRGVAALHATQLPHEHMS